jgi:hypothetical protein
MSDIIEKKPVYVTLEVAALIEQAETDQEQLRIAKKVAVTKSINMETELAQLDDDLVRFKAACLLHKVELGKVYDEQSKKMDDLINECWDVMPVAKANAQKMADEIQPFADQITTLEVRVKSIRDLANGVDFYGMHGFIEAMEKLNSMSADSKEMLGFLMANFKR